MFTSPATGACCTHSVRVYITELRRHCVTIRVYKYSIDVRWTGTCKLLNNV